MTGKFDEALDCYARAREADADSKFVDSLEAMTLALAGQARRSVRNAGRDHAPRRATTTFRRSASPTSAPRWAITTAPSRISIARSTTAIPIFSGLKSNPIFDGLRDDDALSRDAAQDAAGVVSQQPAPELTRALKAEPPGQSARSGLRRGPTCALAGGTRLDMTAVDREQADLERHKYMIEPAAWDLIVCWLYWQADLLPDIAAGVRPGGIAALAGKTSGRFATSLDRFREGFPGWTKLASGEDAIRCYLIVRRAGEEAVD